MPARSIHFVRLLWEARRSGRRGAESVLGAHASLGLVQMVGLLRAAGCVLRACAVHSKSPRWAAARRLPGQVLRPKGRAEAATSVGDREVAAGVAGAEGGQLEAALGLGVLDEPRCVAAARGV